MVKLNQHRPSLMGKFKIGHREETIFLFEALGKIGWTAKPRIKCYLRNIIVLFFH